MKPWLKITLLSSFIVGLILLLVAAHRYDQNIVLHKPQIVITLEGADTFINAEEVLKILNRKRLIHPGQRKNELKTLTIEKVLKDISHVKEVEVYQYLGADWEIRIRVRRAIARIFNKQGESYYLDKEGIMMDVSPLHSAHCLVVNGEIVDRKKALGESVIINNESLKSIQDLDEIYRISDYVCDDPLLRSLIGQIYRERNGDYVLTPIVGGQQIVFGSAFTEKEVAEKFEKLKIFYREAIPYEGWNTYEVINLKFRDQIVCKRNSVAQEDN